MARKVYQVLEDDLEGGKADETVSFSLDGVSYEIDLTTDNAAKMRDALAGYVGAARRVGGRTSRGKGRGSSSASRNSGRTAEIRSWAKAQGFEVNDRGRIPANVVAEYEKAKG